MPRPPAGATTDDDPVILRMIDRGASRRMIARALGMELRSVYRRIARLRARWQVVAARSR